MAVSSSQIIASTRRDMMSWVRPLRPWLLFGVVLALGYLPHVAVYASQLMDREHYQFFPLAWLGAIALLWIRRAALRPRADVAVPAIGWAGVIGAALMLAAAGFFISPWLGMVSVVPMALGLAWLIGGWRTVKGITPALVMFATTLRPPGNLDTALIFNLRSLAVQFSSHILDAIGVIHVSSGNVIQVPGGNLLVDEACSGINSLVSVLAIVLFLGLLLRRRTLHLILLMAGVVGIVILVNVMRVSLVTIAYTRWEIDLLTGWKHDALGLALYAVSLGLAASLDQLLLLLGSTIPRRAARRERASPHYGYGEHGQPLGRPGPAPTPGDEAAPPVATAAGAVPPRLNRIRKRWLAPIIAGFAAFALIQLTIWTYGSRVLKAGRAEAFHLVTHAQQVISEESLPPELAGWQRIGFTTQQRERDDPFGMYSNAWSYRRGRRKVQVSLDYPFNGWHDLTVCYRSIEWNLRNRADFRGSSDPGANDSSTSATLDRDDGRFAHLMFGLINNRGDWVEPPSRSGMLRTREMPWELTPNYQIQVFCTSFTPLGAEEEQQVAELFEASRRMLREQLFASGAITP